MIYESYSRKLIGILFDVHRQLGRGFAEIVYKDAIEYELNLAEIQFEWEKEYRVLYKGVYLKHKFYADFVVFDKIVLEIKTSDLIDAHYAQCINYLKISNNKLALLVNFNKPSLEFRRIVLYKLARQRYRSVKIQNAKHKMFSGTYQNP